MVGQESVHVALHVVGMMQSTWVEERWFGFETNRHYRLCSKLGLARLCHLFVAIYRLACPVAYNSRGDGGDRRD